MESGHLGAGGYTPRTTLVAGHIVLGAAKVDLYLLGLGSIYAKHHATILKHTWIAVTVYVGYWRVRSLGKVLFGKWLCCHLGAANGRKQGDQQNFCSHMYKKKNC